MKNLIKDALVLFGITLVAGLLLGVVYEITKEPRSRQAELTRLNAFKTVFSEYLDEHEEFHQLDYKNISFSDVDLSQLDSLNESLKKAGFTEKKVVVNEAVRADIGDVYIGYAVTVTSKGGYGGDIKFTVGFLIDGTVTGISYLSITETAGLGMEAKNPSFTNKFVGKKGGSFVVDKDNSKGLPNEIDAISGATITTRAVTQGVNAAYIVLTNIVGGDINE